MENNYLKILDKLHEEFPEATLVYKQHSKFMRLLGDLLFFNKSFLYDYTTTIGNHIYLPIGWDTWPEDSRTIILRHEMVHLRHQKRYGLFLYGFLYLFLFFPIGLSYFRMRFEKEAYEESIRAHFDIYGKALALSFMPYEKKDYIRFFTGPDYGWMWPFKKNIENWFDSTVRKYSK